MSYTEDRAREFPRREAHEQHLRETGSPKTRNEGAQEEDADMSTPHSPTKDAVVEANQKLAFLEQRLDNVESQTEENHAMVTSCGNEIYQLQQEVTCEGRELEEAKTELREAVRELHGKIDDLTNMVTVMNGKLDTTGDRLDVVEKRLDKEEKAGEERFRKVQELLLKVLVDNTTKKVENMGIYDC